ncbi:MAG: hypothetical protein PSN36_07340 [Gammaproteobacteria bacterium]|nr:hypothetical protein [Gammaproteobacteria bacterium]
MMKNVKTLLLATLASFMMVTSIMANSIGSDADLIFSNDNAQVQSVDLAKLSTIEMQETEGAVGWFVVWGVSFIASRWSSPVY